MGDADDNLRAVRLVYERAEEAAGAPPTPPRSEREDGLPGELGVTPLGVLGDHSFFLDALRQLRKLKPDNFSRQWLKSLCGARSYLLEKHFPRCSARTGEVLGPDYDAAATAFSSAAAAQGVFDPSDRIRGAGAWLGESGELVLNRGGAVIAGGRYHEPGAIGRFVYPGGAPLPLPWENRVGAGARGPGAHLLSLLASWNWRRGKLDAQLLLGFICAGMIGGAVDWRPVLWVTGGRNTGKSTLHHTLEYLYGGALVAVSDASAAGVWQKLGHATLPVVLDEVEAEEDNRRAQGVVKLARQAASGGLVLRGGADHGAAEFVARSCFLFSSILMPPLLGQDRSRIAILELGELPAGPPPDLERAALRTVGQKLLRLLLDGWPRWAPTLALYRAALMETGHNARGADLFGTLLAAADLVLSDELPDHDTVREFAEQLDFKSLAEAEDDARDDERCMQHLLTQALPLEGVGNKRPVAEWIARGGVPSLFEVDRDDAARVLGRYGLKVIQEGVERYLAIASAHAELGKLFAGTHWAGRSGAVGVWTQTLRRAPGARPSRKSVWFAGASAKATLLPLKSILRAPGEQETSAEAAARSLALEDAGDEA